MALSPETQWLFDNARRLKGVRLKFQRYTRWSETWDHDHCAGCWATFAEFDGPEVQHEGFATCEDYPRGGRYEWVCQICFWALKDELQWTAVQQS